MSLQVRIGDLITAVGTDYKWLRTQLTGSSTGDLTSLTTTNKTSIIAAINETKAGNAGVPADATELVKGILEIATQAETNTGTDDARAVTPLKLQTRLAAYAQPLATNLTDLAGQASTAYGRGFLNLANQAALLGLFPATSDTVASIQRNATQAEVNSGTLDTAQVTPLKMQTRLAAFAQPLNANLTTLAGVVSSTIGRSILSAADAAAVKTLLTLTKTDVGLSNVPNTDATARANHTGTQAVATITGLATIATSGSASDLTTGTLPSSVLPPLVINDTFPVVSQAAMLALTAQRGDIAIRSDINRNFILTTDVPSVLGNWVQLAGGSDVLSVAGRTGAVVLTSADVGLGNVTNTSDANKPVSTAQDTADQLRLLKTANLSDLANAATARTNLSVYSQTELGNPETDLVALYTTAKA